MAGVRLISSSLIQAENHSETTRIELSPWDLMLLPYGEIQKGLLFPNPKHESTTDLIHHLKTSLARTLHHFPPLAGRLATTEHEDDTVSYFFDCNNAGALFIHAAADGVTISDITESFYVPKIVHSFFPMNGLNNIKGLNNPLLGIQVTHLEDGFFIGCTINHSVADGTSFWHFFNSWSQISTSGSNSNQIPKSPVFQRWVPDGIHFPVRFPRSHIQQVFAKEFSFPPNPQLVGKIFHFTRESLQNLKATANAEVGTTNISSLQAMLSHIWRSVIRNKNLEGDGVINYLIVAGSRQRFQELPENYFGNAMMARFVTMKAKELLKEGIGSIALRMNRAIGSMTEESIKKFLVCWPESPRLSTMDSRPKEIMVTNSSPRFNMYGNDFGWGKPIAIRNGMEDMFDGKITLLSGAEEGSVDVELCLSLPTLEAMLKDPIRLPHVFHAQLFMCASYNAQFDTVLNEEFYFDSENGAENVNGRANDPNNHPEEVVVDNVEEVNNAENHNEVYVPPYVRANGVNGVNGANNPNGQPIRNDVEDVIMEEKGEPAAKVAEMVAQKAKGKVNDSVTKIVAEPVKKDEIPAPFTRVKRVGYVDPEPKPLGFQMAGTLSPRSRAERFKFPRKKVGVSSTYSSHGTFSSAKKPATKAHQEKVVPFSKRSKPGEATPEVEI
ncbi:Transferase [Corchorus olitorius]|uniref:Transferase n=1 Tax=Corchorus olitorius TaxID=93759 RepID=A0A1R3I914_9ROSI|nr:Transferase [Corchorus olitorius]